MAKEKILVVTMLSVKTFSSGPLHYVAVDKLPIITLTGLVANPAKYADGR